MQAIGLAAGVGGGELSTLCGLGSLMGDAHRVCVCDYIRTHNTYMWMHVIINIYIYIFVYMYISIYIYKGMCICIYIYTTAHRCL